MSYQLIHASLSLEYDEAPEDFPVYQGIYLDEGFYQDLRLVNDYIARKEKEGYKVYIISPDGSQYYLGKNQNHNQLDLILQGNLGYHGEERLVEEMKQIDNPLFLKRENLIFQESKIVDDFVKQNYECVDKIGDFNVYQKGE